MSPMVKNILPTIIFIRDYTYNNNVVHLFLSICLHFQYKKIYVNIYELFNI